EKVKGLYLAISPNGDFVVEFVWQLRAYNVENENVKDSEKNNYLGLKNGLSYRKFSEFVISKNTFTDKQSELTNSENKLNHSIEKEILSLDKYGGIVKLFSKNEDKKKSDKDSQNMDKNTNEDNYQNIDKSFLYPTIKIQSLDYPKRIRKALKYNNFSAERTFLDKNYYQLEQSNSFVIVVKNKEEEEMEFSEDKQIYDDLISDHTYSKQKGFADTDNKKFFIFDLDNRKSELDNYYYIIEPWVRLEKGGAPRYSVYLDKEKEILLLIGSDTIQVWHDRAAEKKRTLEFISVIDDKNDINHIEYENKKFRITKKSQSVIEMSCDDDLTITVIEACRTLKFLKEKVDRVDKIVKYLSLSDEKHYSKFQEIIKLTRNIIVRFIQLYPITWRLLDVRYDLLSILIEAGERRLIKYVLLKEKKEIDYSQKPHDYLPDQDSLLHEKSLHMPQISSWEGKGNTIRKAYSDRDPTYLGYLLEYYSNKAVKNIRWMITVGEILPGLYTKKNEYYKSYQLLFYKRCFCEKGLDIPFFDFLVIPQSTQNSLVFIPITQLIPQNSGLKAAQ
ncbi:10723_t:CDS:10, partial [Dentiscutata erythropus]